MRTTKTKTGKVIQHIQHTQAARHAQSLHYFNLYVAPLVTVVLIYAMARLAWHSVRSLLTPANKRRI